jgi:hypothetical protein
LSLGKDLTVGAIAARVGCDVTREPTGLGELSADGVLEPMRADGWRRAQCELVDPGAGVDPAARWFARQARRD